MKVEITYFSDNGKYYSKGSFIFDKRKPLSDVWEHAENMLRKGDVRPGFIGYKRKFFHVLINVPNNKYDKPFIIPFIRKTVRRT